MATVQTRLAALSKAHELFIAANAHLNLGPEVNPLRDPRVRQLGKRDRTLLLFGWASGGRRRSEITAATFENVLGRRRVRIPLGPVEDQSGYAEGSKEPETDSGGGGSGARGVDESSF